LEWRVDFLGAMVIGLIQAMNARAFISNAYCDRMEQTARKVADDAARARTNPTVPFKLTDNCKEPETEKSEDSDAGT